VSCAQLTVFIKRLTHLQAWLAPEFKDGEYLGYDEVQDALSDVLSVASGR
jgi:hypothetical protein